MKSIYYREQKHICGKNYDTAPYMEVDLYPVTPKQHMVKTSKKFFIRSARRACSGPDVLIKWG